MYKNVKFILSRVIILLLITLTSCGTKPKKESAGNFSFIFMTDIHLQPELNATTGFQQAMDSINALNPDFVITGGDLIMDALGQSFGRSDSLYNLYEKLIQKLKMPVFNTMGNHEIHGLYTESGAKISDLEYGEKMFEKRLGESYYSFMHKGWKFMIINSVEDTRKNSYTGWIDSTQMSWIEQELAQTRKETPIVLATHIPFISVFTQKYYSSTFPNDSSLIVANSKNVIDLFKEYNLKLVLQGHLHAVEDIFVDGIHFITGGSVCAAWWEGPYMGYEEGFMNIKLKDNQVSWEYKDYGWKAVQ